MPTRCLAIRLSRPGWNKRSGSTKRERDLFKVRSVIDIDSPFASELWLHKGFFLLFQAIGFLLQGVFLSAVVNRGDLLFLTSNQVEPLRLFHPTIGGLRNIT
ncbi:MAG: hypothetical protein GXP18_02535 [Gammaproteobacteria bacterium]|nr:hypothetical protein [Gammaproteobacteria bacterium]